MNHFLKIIFQLVVYSKVCVAFGQPYLEPELWDLTDYQSAPDSMYYHGEISRIKFIGHPLLSWVAFNSLGQVDSLANQEGGVTRYSYNTKRELIEIESPYEVTTFNWKNDSTLVTTLVDHFLYDGDTTQITYSFFNSQKKCIREEFFGRHTITNFINYMEYDKWGKMIMSTQKRGDDLLYVIQYEYDTLGRKVKMIEQSRECSYFYDQASRLVREVHANNQIYNYSYFDQDSLIVESDNGRFYRNSIQFVYENDLLIQYISDQYLPSLLDTNYKLNCRFIYEYR